ncbi:MAG: Do family serine endopeptidase [Deltaproteobacteria bacterium]|jgi:serine protease Do|nr:Do family serine endopeptidase [Deltaproteobacteria bacterium]
MKLEPGIFLFSAFLSLLLFGGGLMAQNTIAPQVQSQTAQSPATLSSPSSSGGGLVTMSSVAPIVDKAQAAVVNILTTKTVARRGPGDLFGFGPNMPQLDPRQPMNPEDMFDFFFNNPQSPFRQGPPPRSFKEKAQGSGFIYDAEGYIVTNNHVVEEAEEIKVTLDDGREIEAKVVGRDPKTDLALIKLVTEGRYPFLTLGNSDALKIGDWLVAIGNPFGLDHTVTAGILSARGRAIGAGPYDDFLQTDASINPGNSGGPLLNLDGEVVGINTMITSQGTGIGFAIPSKMVVKIIAQLKTKGFVERGKIGVYIQPVTQDMAKTLGLDEAKGALVSDIVPDSPAEKSGIKHGDVVVEFDGQPIGQFSELTAIVADTPVGKVVSLVVVRAKKRTPLKLTVALLEDDTLAISGTSEASIDLGLTLRPLTPEKAKELGIDSKGLVVEKVEPTSMGADSGIRVSDIILEVDRRPVDSIQDYVDILKAHNQEEALLLWVRRDKLTIYVSVPLK